MPVINCSISSGEIIRSEYKASIIPTANDLVNLFYKVAILPWQVKSSTAHNSYYKSLQEKSVLRCLVLAVPIIRKTAIKIYHLIHKHNRDAILSVVQQNCWALQGVKEEFKNDKKIALTAVQQNGGVLQHVGQQLRNDRQVALAAVQQEAWALIYVGDSLRDTKEIVLAAVRQNGLMLKYVSEKLRNDKEIALAAVQQNGIMIRCVSQRLRNNKKVVLAAIQQNGRAMKFVDKVFSNDKNLAFIAVKQDGNALQYISQQLKNDKKVVLAAVRQDGCALQYASKKLRNDRKVVLVAVQQNAWAFHYASEQCKKNQEILLAHMQIKIQTTLRNKKNAEKIERLIKKIETIEYYYNFTKDLDKELIDCISLNPHSLPVKIDQFHYLDKKSLTFYLYKDKFTRICPKCRKELALQQVAVSTKMQEEIIKNLKNIHTNLVGKKV